MQSSSAKFAQQAPPQATASLTAAPVKKRAPAAYQNSILENGQRLLVIIGKERRMIKLLWSSINNSNNNIQDIGVEPYTENTHLKI